MILSFKLKLPQHLRFDSVRYAAVSLGAIQGSTGLGRRAADPSKPFGRKPKVAPGTSPCGAYPARTLSSTHATSYASLSLFSPRHPVSSRAQSGRGLPVLR